MLRNELEHPKEFRAMQCLFSKLSSTETSRQQATRDERLLKPLCAETWNWYCLFSAFILILHSFELSFYWLNEGWKGTKVSEGFVENILGTKVMGVENFTLCYPPFCQLWRRLQTKHELRCAAAICGDAMCGSKLQCACGTHFGSSLQCACMRCILRLAMCDFILQIILAIMKELKIFCFLLV
jgi:hypothetical protein